MCNFPCLKITKFPFSSCFNWTYQITISCFWEDIDPIFEMFRNLFTGRRPLQLRCLQLGTCQKASVPRGSVVYCSIPAGLLFINNCRIRSNQFFVDSTPPQNCGTTVMSFSNWSSLRAAMTFLVSLVPQQYCSLQSTSL